MTFGGAADSSQTPDLTEDLGALAEFSFRTAQTTCRACNEYHALFTYTRWAGVNNGTKPDEDVAAAALRKVSRPGARILIAGAADAGLLALTARATLGIAPHITVADRCATPLAVCRRYAEMHNLEIATAQAELIGAPLPGPFDVAFAHNVLFFIAPEKRTLFLKNLGVTIGKGNSLVLINRVRRPKWSEAGSLKFGNFAAEIENALAARGIPLPEPDAAFRSRLETAAAAEHGRSAVPLSLEDIQESLAAAGFRIEERIDHHRRKTTFARDGQASESVPTHVFIATFVGS